MKLLAFNPIKVGLFGGYKKLKKVTKNQGFTLLRENAVLEKQGGGKLTSPSFFRIKRFYENLASSAAKKGWSTVNYQQSLAFDHPYLSCNDHCYWWLFQEIYYFYFVEILLNDLELVLLELLNIQNSFLFHGQE